MSITTDWLLEWLGGEVTGDRDLPNMDIEATKRIRCAWPSLSPADIEAIDKALTERFENATGPSRARWGFVRGSFDQVRKAQQSP